MLEICCSSREDAIHAEDGGADRIELCAGWELGGLTPSPALTRSVCAAVSLPVRVLIRPRTGHFVFNSVERALMMDEIRQALDGGAEGIVAGGLTPAGDLDRELIEMVRHEVPATAITFHRAFDEVRTPVEAYGQLCDYRIDCVLTSGAAASAIEGVRVIQQLAEHRGLTRIMAGSGVQAAHIAALRQAGATWFHLSARRDRAAPYPHRLFNGELPAVDPDRVRQLRDALNVQQS